MPYATLDQPKSLFRFEYEAITLYGFPFQEYSSTKKFSNFLQLNAGLSETPNHKCLGLGFFPFARHYLGNTLFSFYSSGY